MDHGTSVAVSARRHRRQAVAGLALSLALTAAGLNAAGPAVGATPAAQTFTACPSEAQLASAVAAQGTITFSVSCTVSFTTPISIPVGHTVDIEAGGFNVEFSGNAETRFFTDSGGTLTLGGLTLQGGAVVGAAGTAGKAGASGATGPARPARPEDRALRAGRPRPGRTGPRARARRAARSTWSRAPST